MKSVRQRVKDRLSPLLSKPLLLPLRAVAAPAVLADRVEREAVDGVAEVARAGLPQVHLLGVELRRLPEALLLAVVVVEHKRPAVAAVAEAAPPNAALQSGARVRILRNLPESRRST